MRDEFIRFRNYKNRDALRVSRPLYAHPRFIPSSAFYPLMRVLSSHRVLSPYPYLHSKDEVNPAFQRIPSKFGHGIGEGLDF